jgi:hypothetical protein
MGHAGGTDGKVQVFDLRTGEPVASHTVAADTVNGFHFHPFLPLAAIASGAVLPISATNLMHSSPTQQREAPANCYF